MHVTGMLEQGMSRVFEWCVCMCVCRELVLN